MPGARLSRFARRVALSARKKRCALPGCGRDTRVLSCCCCGKALCAQCRVRTLRASFGRRLVSRCPFCRRAARPRAPALKRLLAAACPSHALIVETEGGPPSVVAHLPCAEGRYCSRGSRVLQSSWSLRSHYLSRKRFDRPYDFALEELIVLKRPSIQRAFSARSKTC